MTEPSRTGRGGYHARPELTAAFTQARGRLAKGVYPAIVARVETFTKEWRNSQHDGELSHWQLSPINRGRLRGCGVMHFRYTSHYRIAYIQVPQPFPRLVFIEAYSKEDEEAALARIQHFVKSRGYC